MTPRVTQARAVPASQTCPRSVAARVKSLSISFPSAYIDARWRQASMCFRSHERWKKPTALATSFFSPAPLRYTPASSKQPTGSPPAQAFFRKSAALPGSRTAPSPVRYAVASAMQSATVPFSQLFFVVSTSSASTSATARVDSMTPSPAL
jgi:hypothetical protein